MGNISFELKILDEDYRKIGFWKFPASDAAKFFRIVSRKHNLGIIIKEKKKNDIDLDWIK